MSVNAKVDIFTAAMKAQFLNAYFASAKPLPYEQFTEKIPSDARIEHYTWMSPTPGLSRYTGHRRYGKIDTVRYSVENVEFDSSFEVPLRDVEDDQTGGYSRKPAELSEFAKKFPSRWVTKHLAAGASRTCFDGTNFFADSHSIGTGDNLMTATGTANSDGLSYKLAFLFTGHSLKPLLWQARKEPNFQTNSGTPQSFESKMLRYWIDLEGEAAYGYWWDAILLTFTNAPSVTDLHTQFAAVEARFRTFTLPKALDSDDGEYVFEQEQFSTENLCIVANTALAETLRQALNSDWVPQSFTSPANFVVPTTNRFKGFANYLVSSFMN